MARIVCQVLHRADRITFLWSEGAASFEPYHLEGAERTALLQLAARLYARLAEADATDLAQLGHQLYRAMFRLESGDYGSAGGVQAWLAKLIETNSIERLEFLSDAPGLIPWNMLTESAGAGFWGARFNVGAGRRVNALRQNPTQVNPTLLSGVDPVLVAQLPANQQLFLKPGDAGKMVRSISTLQDELKQHAPDIFLLLVRCEDGMLRLGADSFSIGDLEKWFAEARDGNPDPLVILMGCGAAAEQSAWQTLLAAASATFSGLVANETLLDATRAFAVGQAIAQRFAAGKQSLGEILRTLRQEQPAAAAVSAFCPPQVRVVADGATDGPAAENQIEIAPLPRWPYRPFAAYGAADRALFFGRDEDTVRGALATDRADTLGVILHGSPGAGKTSYLQAGLLPYLEEESVGYRVLRDRSPEETPVAEKDQPILILRCTSDLAGQFADALLAFCAQPLVFTTPAGTDVTIDLPTILQQTVTGSAGASTTAIQPAPATGITATPGEDDDEADTSSQGLSLGELWIALRDNNDMLGKILDAITRRLPFELVIAIDQGDEIVTQVVTVHHQARRQKALDMLMHLSHVAPRCKIVFTIRTQYLGQFISLLPDGRTPADWRSFFLRPLSEPEMVDALLWPTNRAQIPYSDEIPYQKYNFAFEDGMGAQVVAEALDAAAVDQQSPLPIVQAMGALLYENQVLIRKQDVLRSGDIKDLGGAREALTKYLDQTLEKLPITKQARQALRGLIAKLYISHADGTVSRNVILASELKGHWTAPGDEVEPIVNLAVTEQGLFEVQELLIGGQPDVYVGLPQDSLAQLGKKIEGQRELQAYAWTKVTDVLWIMIPLMFLAAAVTFWGTRQYIGGAADPNQMRREIAKEVIEEIKEAVEEDRQRIIRTALRDIFYGDIAQADQALRAGNTQRAQEALLTQMKVFGKARDSKMHDMRGFEWQHLWRRLNSERHLLEGHRGSVTSLAVSKDGTRAASAGVDGSVRVWNLQTGKIVAAIPGPKTVAHAVALSPDGKSVASAGDDKIVRLWDLGDLKDEMGLFLKEPKKLEGHTDAIHTIAFGKDASELASAGADKSVILWDIAVAKAKHTLKEHTAAVKALAYSSDGKTLVSAGDEANLFVWDPSTGKKVNSKDLGFRTIAALSLSPDGKFVAAAGVETKLDNDIGAIRFLALGDAKDAPASISPGPGFLAVTFGSDGKLASGGNDNIIRIWDIKTGKELQHWIGHGGAVNAVAFAKDAAVVSGGADGTVKIWDPNPSNGIDVIPAHAEAVQALVLNRDSTLLASGSRDGSVKLWDPKTNKLVKDLGPHKGAVTALAFSSHKDKEIGKAKDKDEFFLAVGTRDAKNDGDIKIWQINKEGKDGWKVKEHLTLKDQTKGITCLAFSPSEDKADILVAGSSDKTVKVWDAKAGKMQKSHAGHKDEVRCVAFSVDGKIFASGGKDALVCVHELGNDTIRTLKDMHLGAIESIALFDMQLERRSDDEHHTFMTGILTGGTDQSVRLWSYDHLAANADGDRKLVQRFAVHTDRVSAVAYNKKAVSDIFSAGWDGSIVICDRARERLRLTGHQGGVRALAVADDQSFLASAGSDGTIRIWRTLADGGAKAKEEVK